MPDLPRQFSLCAPVYVERNENTFPLNSYYIYPCSCFHFIVDKMLRNRTKNCPRRFDPGGLCKWVGGVMSLFFGGGGGGLPASRTWGPFHLAISVSKRKAFFHEGEKLAISLVDRDCASSCCNRKEMPVILPKGNGDFCSSR